LTQPVCPAKVRKSCPVAAEIGLCGRQSWIPLHLREKFLPVFSSETGRFSKKNREAIEHEQAITERD